jgi:hypothetical protein
MMTNAQGIGRKSTLWICLWKSRRTAAGGTPPAFSGNWSGKPGFAQQNAPKKRKSKQDIKVNTASNRVC